MSNKEIKNKIQFLKWRLDNLTNVLTKKSIIENHGLKFYNNQIDEILDELINLRKLLE